MYLNFNQIILFYESNISFYFYFPVSNPILPKNIGSNPITQENNSVSLEKPNGKFFRHLKYIWTNY